MRCEGYVADMGRNRNVYGVLVGKLKNRGTFGRPRCRWDIILKWILMN
jgi:hypothetical protein